MAKPPITRDDLIKLDTHLFEIPRSYAEGMLVPARIYMQESMLADIAKDASLQQLVNVACLPGIVNAAYAMPDIHQGYGFPIGGVAATAIDHGGVISPGGIGYDINCGVRLLAVNMTEQELKPHIQKLATALYNAVPSGVGRGGKIVLEPAQLDAVLRNGAHEMVAQGYGEPHDIAVCEEFGRMQGADPDAVSEQAKQRGRDQLGTLGSGNHFLEIQVVDEIFDAEAAQALGLSLGQVTVMIHCGSRGLGHQTCTDYVRTMMKKLPTWGYTLPDRELVCAPFLSPEGQEYYAAMSAAANFAWANRHLIGHWVRQTWQAVIGPDVQVKTVYDVCHNIGKKETHVVDGMPAQLLVHRKGATRAFGPGQQGVPLEYLNIGQPVLIPGTMGTSSYVLVGTHKSMELAFGSSCHGAGRKMSRMQAKKMVGGVELRKELERQGIVVRCDSDAGLSEEAPVAYKDVDSVVQVVHEAGIARKVVRVRPWAVIKGG